MIMNFIAAVKPYVSHTLVRTYHIWTVLQANKVYGAIAESAPGLI